MQALQLPKFKAVPIRQHLGQSAIRFLFMDLNHVDPFVRRSAAGEGCTKNTCFQRFLTSHAYTIVPQHNKAQQRCHHYLAVALSLSPVAMWAWPFFIFAGLLRISSTEIDGSELGLARLGVLVHCGPQVEDSSCRYSFFHIHYYKYQLHMTPLSYSPGRLRL